MAAGLTGRAVDALCFVSSRVLSGEEIAAVRKAVRREEEVYQAAFLQKLGELVGLTAEEPAAE